MKAKQREKNRNNQKETEEEAPNVLHPNSDMSDRQHT